jgi:dTDP-L-rhamnose 4-epimerase
MSEHILVTGGAGFIGSHIVDELLLAGHQVRVLDNLEPQVHGKLHEGRQPPAYLNPEAEFIFGDVRDAEAVTAALQDIDVVFHEAARVGVAQSMYEIVPYSSVNVVGTAVLLQAITEAPKRPRKIIVASSMSIYGEGAYRCPIHGAVYPALRSIEQLQARDWEMHCPIDGCDEQVLPQPTDETKPLFPTSVYAINKRDQEELFLAVGRAYQIPTVALRYFNVYGERQALSNPYTGVAAIFSGLLLNNKAPVIFEDGKQYRDFTHISDIAQANLLVMDRPEADYGVFNVGTGRKLSIGTIAEALLEHFRNFSPAAADLQPEIVQKFRAGDIRHCYSDISRLQALGYRPRMRFEDGLGELVEWVRLQTASDHYEQARQELLRKGLAI